MIIQASNLGALVGELSKDEEQLKKDYVTSDLARYALRFADDSRYLNNSKDKRNYLLNDLLHPNNYDKIDKHYDGSIMKAQELQLLARGQYERQEKKFYYPDQGLVTSN